MAFKAKPIAFKPGRLNGLSVRLIASHYENNYGGAVRRLNAIKADLAKLQVAAAPGFIVNGLKREELIATNSMLLHELYFDCLGSGPEPMAPAMALALQSNFGSVERWREEFVGMGKALGGGSGWVLLVFQPREGTLVNQWAADHAHAVAGGVPVLALDMFEHSYHMDFGAAAGPYVDAFMENIDWGRVHERYQAAVACASERFAAAHEDLAGALVLDVRRRGVYEAADAVIPGAAWQDPGQVDAWARQLRADTRVVVYCVHGHEVSRSSAMRLRAAGLDARFLRGGIEGWRAAGQPLASRAAGGMRVSGALGSD